MTTLARSAKQEGKIEQMEKKENYFDCVIGRNQESNATELLIAPLYSGLKVGDVVKARRKFEKDEKTYKVIFIDSYHKVDDVLMTALFVVTGEHPVKISARVEERLMDWEDVDG